MLNRREFLGVATSAAVGLVAPLSAATAKPSASTGRIAVTGGDVVWRRLAKGRKTPMLLLHGGPGVPGDYLDPLGGLDDDRSIFTYDQLGCGRSDHPDDVKLWTIGRFVDELDKVRSGLGLDRVHLYAQSWGTMLVAEYLFTRHPDGITSIVFASPCFSSSRFTRDAERLVETLSRASQDAVADANRTGRYDTDPYKAAVDEFYGKYLCRRGKGNPYFERSLGGLSEQVYGTMWGPSEFSVLGNLKDFDRVTDLPSIKIPTLLLCGEFDECTPVTTRDYASMVSRSEFAEIKGSAHLTTIDAPAATLKAVRRFLARVESA
jgi:proline iminopeptidase